LFYLFYLFNFFDRDVRKMGPSASAKQTDRAEKEKKNMARKVLAKGMSIQDASELTGLSVKEIQEL
jgi:hypothetical protein